MPEGAGAHHALPRVALTGRGRQYWIHLTLHQPINERWREEQGENWSRGELVNDGIVKRGVTVEATTHLGRRALRIVETLHGAHPFNELKRPERGDWYG